jgi:uncharacterized membrane protein
VISELLALASAVSFGLSDFSGALGAKRAPATVVVFVAHCVGLMVALGLAVLLPGSPTGATVVAGALGGLSGAVGLVALYQGLAGGRMAVVAPVSAVVGTTVPVLWGLGSGERLGAGGSIGVVLAILAIVLVSVNGSIVSSGLREASIAGIGFAGFFIALSFTDVDTGLWPLVPARIVSIVLLGSLLSIRRRRIFLPVGSRLPVVLAGAGDTAANALYLAAVQRGLLSSAVVLSSLYPVVTVLAGRVVLREHVAPLQWLGIGMAVGVVALLAG